MSGSGPIRTAHLFGATTVALVEAIPAVQQRTAAMTTLVGGLAVLAQVRSPHRATTDVDLVDDRLSTEPRTLEVLHASGAAAVEPAGAHVPTEHGFVRVDVLEVTDVDLARLPDDPTDRLHVLAHHWASTETVTVQLVASDGAAQHATATTRAAAPGPLVATKLQSAMNRGHAKQATDLLDIIRLTFDEEAGPVVDQQLRAADLVLAQDALLHATHWFGDRAATTLRTIQAVAGSRAATLDDVETTGRILRAALARPAHS